MEKKAQYDERNLRSFIFLLIILPVSYLIISSVFNDWAIYVIGIVLVSVIILLLTYQRFPFILMASILITPLMISLLLTSSEIKKYYSELNYYQNRPHKITNAQVTNIRSYSEPTSEGEGISGTNNYDIISYQFLDDSNTLIETTTTSHWNHCDWMPENCKSCMGIGSTRLDICQNTTSIKVEYIVSNPKNSIICGLEHFPPFESYYGLIGKSIVKFLVHSIVSVPILFFIFLATLGLVTKHED